MVPPYATTFMDSLEEDILSNSFLKTLVSWYYIDESLWCGDMGKKSLKSFQRLNSSYYKVYSKILQGKNRISGCYCMKNLSKTN